MLNNELIQRLTAIIRLRKETKDEKFFTPPRFESMSPTDSIGEASLLAMSYEHRILWLRDPLVATLTKKLRTKTNN